MKVADLTPDLCLPSLVVLTPGLLDAAFPGVRGLTIDLDGAVLEHHGETVPEEHLRALAAITQAGYPIGVSSNAHKIERADRARGLARQIAEATGSDVPIVTSNEVGQRKPKPAMFFRLARLMGQPNNTLVHFGDQMFKDVAGAKRAGYLGTILVPRFGEGDDKRVKYVQRPAEAVIRRRLNLPF